MTDRSNQKRNDLIHRLDDEVLQAQSEIEKSMHSAGNLADYFDIRDEVQICPDAQKIAVTSFKDAALDHDITHDYLIATAGHLAELRNLLNQLMEMERESHGLS